MSKNNTPTAVRVARWTAIAAFGAALGSFLNTMWTSAPWWVKTSEERAAEHASSTSAHISSLGTTPDDAPMSMMMSVSEPELYEKVMLYIQHHTSVTALIVVSGLIGLVAMYIEYKHRKKVKEVSENVREPKTVRSRVLPPR